MDIWDWFSDNEKLLSGLAAALVILRIRNSYRNFLQIIISLGSKPSKKITLSDLSSPSPTLSNLRIPMVSIAYTVFEIEPDLVVTPGIISNIRFFKSQAT